MQTPMEVSFKCYGISLYALFNEELNERDCFLAIAAIDPK
jgi:hypothetical protein